LKAEGRNACMTSMRSSSGLWTGFALSITRIV
jgi:hypothetical protein